MSDHMPDEGTPLASCDVCGTPLYEEDEIHRIKDFSGKGQHGVFCTHHYEKMTLPAED